VDQAPSLRLRAGAAHEQCPPACRGYISGVDNHVRATVECGACSKTTHDRKSEVPDPRVEEALRKVLDSTAFASSKQSQALLKYLVANSQHDDDGSLKERMIGVNVFGRSHDYNTGDDPIVRARVGEVRKRLARYYQSELTDQHTIQFAIPTGSYRVTFSYPDVAETTDQPGRRADSREETPDESIRSHKVQPPAGVNPSPRHLKRWTMLLAGFVAVLVFVGVIHQHRESRRTSVLNAFWSPLLDSSQSVVIYLGAKTALTCQRLLT
jgi:hypothetical protein